MWPATIAGEMVLTDDVKSECCYIMSGMYQVNDKHVHAIGIIVVLHRYTRLDDHLCYRCFLFRDPISLQPIRQSTITTGHFRCIKPNKDCLDRTLLLHYIRTTSIHNANYCIDFSYTSNVVVTESTPDIFLLSCY